MPSLLAYYGVPPTLSYLVTDGPVGRRISALLVHGA